MAPLSSASLSELQKKKTHIRQSSLSKTPALGGLTTGFLQKNGSFIFPINKKQSTNNIAHPKKTFSQVIQSDLFIP